MEMCHLASQFDGFEHFTVVGYKPCPLQGYLCQLKHELSVLNMWHNFVIWQQCLDGIAAMLVLLLSILFWRSVVCLNDRWIFLSDLNTFFFFDHGIKNQICSFIWPFFIWCYTGCNIQNWQYPIACLRHRKLPKDCICEGASGSGRWPGASLRSDSHPNFFQILVGWHSLVALAPSCLMFLSMTSEWGRLPPVCSCFHLASDERSLLLVDTEELRSPVEVVLNCWCGMYYHSRTQRRSTFWIFLCIFCPSPEPNKTCCTFCEKGLGTLASQNVQHVLFWDFAS